MDRGDNDYRLFERWTSEGVGFVARLKKNAMWASHEERPVKPGGKIRRDTEGGLVSFDASRRIVTRFRRVTVWIEEKGDEMELLTNRFDLSAETIAEIYNQHWQIELFFKSIKQNLRIKTFVGTSTNAVRIQNWTACGHVEAGKMNHTSENPPSPPRGARPSNLTNPAPRLFWTVVVSALDLTRMARQPAGESGTITNLFQIGRWSPRKQCPGR